MKDLWYRSLCMVWKSFSSMDARLVNIHLSRITCTRSKEASQDWDVLLNTRLSILFMSDEYVRHTKNVWSPPQCWKGSLVVPPYTPKYPSLRNRYKKIPNCATGHECKSHVTHLWSLDCKTRRCLSWKWIEKWPQLISDHHFLYPLISDASEMNFV